MTRARKLANLGNQNAFTVDSGSLNVGIGSTRPDYKLDVDGTAYVGGGVTISGTLSVGGTVTYEDVTNVDAVGIITANSGVNIVGGGLTVTGVGTFFGGVGIADSIFHVGDTNTQIRFPAADTITAETAGSEHMRINSTGKLLIGTDSSRQTRVGGSNFQGLVQVESDSELGYTLSRFNNSTGGPRFVIQKARGTGDSPTIVQEDDQVAQLLFSGWDGDTFTNVAKINVEVDGAPGDDDMPGRITFQTTADGEYQTTERLRINSSGQLELRKNQNNVTGRPENRIVFKDLDSSVVAEQPIGEISWYSSDSGMTNVNCYIRGINEATNGAGALTFGVKDAGEDEIEALRITRDGRVGIGTTIPDKKLEVFNGCIKVDRRDTTVSGDAHISFRTGPSGNSRLEIYGSSVSDDNSNWIFKTNANEEISFRIASSDIMHLQANGRIGIGTTIADGPLHVYQSSAGIVTAAGDANDLVLESAANVGMSFLTANDSLCRIKFGDPDDDNAGVISYSHANNSMGFATNDGTERMRITSGGDVGIGTDPSSARLHLYHQTQDCHLTVQAVAADKDARLNLYSHSGGVSQIRLGDDTDTNIGRITYYHTASGVYEANSLEFITGDVSRVHIASTGLVLPQTTNEIRTNSSDGSDNKRILLSGGGDNSQTRGAQIALYGNEYSSHEGRLQLLAGNSGDDNGVIQFYTGGAEKARIAQNGKVGIATDGPAAPLHVFGSSPVITSQIHKSNTGTDKDCFRAIAGPTGGAVFVIRAQNAADDNTPWVLKSNANEDIIFNIGGTERARLLGSGLVGIGTSIPSNKLHLAATSNSIFFVESYDTNADIIQADTGGSTRIRSAAGVLTVYGGGDAGSPSAANSSSAGVFANNRFAVGMTPVTTDSTTNVSAGLIQTDGNIDIRYAGTNSDPAGCRWFNFINSDTSLVNGQPCGGINWIGNDTSHSNHVMGRIYGDCAGNSGAGVHFKFDTDGSQRFLINNNGDIGAPSGDNIYDASDERLKENMVELTDGLSKVNKLKPISYNYKVGWNEDTEGKTKYGFGAQTTQEVDEILIEPFSIGDAELNGEKIVNPLRVNEKFVIPLLVKAVQELSAEVASLKSQINN